ncbi:DUF2784 domain-containing protein [Thermodesulfobacteriota bacterium]
MAAIYHILADITILLHFAFLIFAVFGGILVFWWPRVLWLHLPAVIWAVIVEAAGWICPITYLEDWLLIKGGWTVDSGGFVEDYIVPVLYPANYTRNLRILLAVSVVFINMIIYGLLYWYKLKKKTET